MCNAFIEMQNLELKNCFGIHSIHMLTGTLNFYATFSFHRPETVKRKKKWSLKVRNMKAEKILLSRHEAPVAQWTSVLDF